MTADTLPSLYAAHLQVLRERRDLLERLFGEGLTRPGGADEAGDVIGVVTSGGFSPSLGKPIAMGFVPPAQAEVGARLKVIVRGKAQAAEVVAMPFVPHRYVRKL